MQIKGTQMETYTDFAGVYAQIMQDIPYGRWEKIIHRIFRENGIKDGLVLDLCCGTGEMARRFRSLGYDMIGVDASADMLQEAYASGAEGILYLQQDMRNFELYGTVRAIYSTCDSINYLTKEKDLVKVLKLVNNYLDPKGIFVFDLKTVHFYRDVMASTVEAQNLDECSYIWENYYDAGKHLNEYDLTLFIREKDVYRKSEEIHLQRAYTLAEVKKAIQSAGMVFVKAFDEKDGGKVRPGTERMIIVAREKGK